MVGQLKEDVGEWYQGLSAHMRIEAMCTLIDLSMPFEIRFLGSLIEHLGRKDFGSLREAESKANSFVNGNPDDKKRLLKSLSEVAPLCMGNGTQYANPLINPNYFNDSPANRPSPTHVSDSKGRPPPDSFHVPDGQNDHGLPNDSTINSHDAGSKGKVSNHIGFSSEEETESMCIMNDIKRRKLILYISVLSPTNHDGANLYYTILSDIEDSPALAWLEDLEKDAQEEVSLLYTLASRHPAFTFEQRMFLSTVSNRVNEVVSSKYPRGNNTLQMTIPHHANLGGHQIFYNHAAIPQALDPKYSGYYIFAHPPMHIQQSPQQPSTVPSNGEQIRNSAVPTPFPYASFGPYFVPHPHHPAAISHPTPLNPPFAQNMIPIPSSGSMVAGTGQNLPLVVTPIASCSNSNTALQIGANPAVVNSNHQLTSPSSKPQLPQPNPSLPNSVSQPSCLSTPSRTSSVPFQSEQNSVDGDSEESSENCDWNSPESSPFESPPQSLTPSRSQSPPSGVPKSTSVQTVSLSGHGPTFLVASSGNSIPYGGTVNNGSSTIVKTEITSSGLVITTATSCSSTSCSTSTSNGGPVASSSNSIVPNNANKSASSTTISTMHNNTQLPPQPHHPPHPTTSVRPTKNTSTLPINSNTQSFAHPPNTVVVSTSSVISVLQQPPVIPQSMMGPVPVHMQQTTLASANVGIVSHSMSSANPSMPIAFPQTHGAHNSLGMNAPPSQNNFPCYPHINSGVSFGGMNTAATYRAPAQGVLTRNQYMQPHVAAAASALLNNQIGIKGAEMQRGHNVHNNLRQKHQQPQSTPKRRSNNVGMVNVNMPPTVGGTAPPIVNSSQSTSGKGDEVGEPTKDNRSNEIVVSANPSSKGSERTSSSGNKYHHNMSNGIVSSHPGSSAGGMPPGNPVPSISTSNSTGQSNPPSQTGTISSSNQGGPIISSKGSEDGLLGEGVAVMDSYPVNALPYHINGPQVYSHQGGPFIQLPNGYMASSFYPNPGNAPTTGIGCPPVPPSTEIMMNPSCLPHFSFPFTIPQGFPNLPANNNKAGNVKEKPNTIHGHSNSGGGTVTGDTHKNLPTGQHDNHQSSSHPSGYYNRAPSQPSRNNRGVILDIGGGALGNSSLSPVNVDVSVMPPLEEIVETIHRPRKISCYNCGLDTHLGPDCKDGSMEEMTRHQFRVNYSGPSSVTADGKDGD